MSMEPKATPSKIIVRLTVHASPVWFSTIRNLVINICRNCGICDRTSGSIALALDEAVSNIHRHGYHGSSDELIEIQLEAMQAGNGVPWKVKICLEDRATQIDLEQIKSREIEDIRPGGLGVYLIQSIMDHVDWSYREGGGMRLVLEKYGDPISENVDVHTGKTQD